MPLSDFVSAEDLWSYQEGQPEAITRQAQSVIRSYCGWHIAPAIDATLTLDGRGGRHLGVPSLKINSLSAVTNEGEAIDTTSDLDWSESGFIELRAGCWSTRARQIVITLNHGYATIPDDLVEAATSIASRAASSPAGAVEESTGPFRAKWSSVAPGVSGGIALLRHERDILDKYKLPPSA